MTAGPDAVRTLCGLAYNAYVAGSPLVARRGAAAGGGAQGVQHGDGRSQRARQCIGLRSAVSLQAVVDLYWSWITMSCGSVRLCSARI